MSRPEDRGHDSPLVRPEPRLRNQVLELAAEVRRQRAHELRCAVGQRRRVGRLIPHLVLVLVLVVVILVPVVE
eukprot:scaffold84881_cov45-Phaeocystis_antarctica.AAC.1